MIHIDLVLSVGKLEDGIFHEHESWNFAIRDTEESWDVDSVNSILNNCTSAGDKYAELRLHVTGVEHGFLVGSFKKIKLKNQGYHWMVVD